YAVSGEWAHGRVALHCTCPSTWWQQTPAAATCAVQLHCSLAASAALPAAALLEEHKQTSGHCQCLHMHFLAANSPDYSQDLVDSGVGLLAEEVLRKCRL